MSRDSLSIGIDFGTTNSSMAWYNPDTQQSEVILNSEGEYKTPSLVYFGEEETLVGKPVEDLLEDSEGYDPSEREDINQRVVKSIKRNLLSPPIIPIPGREPVRPVEVVAEILGKLKRDAEEGHFHEAVERAVVTCPAIFSAQEWQILFDAAIKAGFKRIEALEEPTAAALTVAREGRRVGRNVLVYDLGAGTFDLSLLSRAEDGSFYVPMEPQGDPRCGGDDFDLALYYHCDEIARRELERPISLSEDIDLAFLRQCRRRKENLSSSRRSRFSSLLPSDNGPIRFRYEIDQAAFENLIRERIEETARKTAAMVKQAKEREHEVDTVVLIGGSTRMPLIVQLLGETLPLEPHHFARKDYAVALGATHRGQELWGEGQEQKAEEYRKDLEICWQDRKLTTTEVEWLRDLVKQELQLSPTTSARVEREVMGGTMAEVLERQERAARERYGKILKLGWQEAKLDVLRRIPSARLEMILDNRELFIGRDFADSPISAGERKEMVGELPWTDFVMAARLATDNSLKSAAVEEQLRSLADGFGLSDEQAKECESDILGSTITEFLEGVQREDLSEQSSHTHLAENTEERVPIGGGRPSADLAAGEIERTTHTVDPMSSGDYATITDAIEAATPGDKILLRPGSYEEGLIVDKPLEIIGEGDRENIVVQTKGKSVLLCSATGGRVGNLTLRQVGDGQWPAVEVISGDIELEECDISSESSDSVAIHGDAQPVFRHNRIHDSKETGIYAYENSKGLLEDNDIFTNMLAGVAITNSANPSLRRNRIHNNNGGGVVITGHGSGTLEDNDIFANAGKAAVAIGTVGNPHLRQNRIYNHGLGCGVLFNLRGCIGTLARNDIFDNALSGVEIANEAEATLEENRIHDNKGNGVLAHANGKGRLADNDIFANTLSGVEIQAGSNLTLRGNRIKENGNYAVYVHGGGGTVEDNELRGNTKGAWNIAFGSKWRVGRARNQE